MTHSALSVRSMDIQACTRALGPRVFSALPAMTYVFREHRAYGSVHCGTEEQCVPIKPFSPMHGEAYKRVFRPRVYILFTSGDDVRLPGVTCVRFRSMPSFMGKGRAVCPKPF